jgi:hypothetical protein
VTGPPGVDVHIDPTGLGRVGSELSTLATQIMTDLVGLSTAVTGLKTGWGDAADDLAAIVAPVYEEMARRAGEAVPSYSDQVALAGWALPAGAGTIAEADAAVAAEVRTVMTQASQLRWDRSDQAWS